LHVLWEAVLWAGRTYALRGAALYSIVNARTLRENHQNPASVAGVRLGDARNWKRYNWEELRRFWMAAMICRCQVEVNANRGFAARQG